MSYRTILRTVFDTNRHAMLFRPFRIALSFVLQVAVALSTPTAPTHVSAQLDTRAQPQTSCHVSIPPKQNWALTLYRYQSCSPGEDPDESQPLHGYLKGVGSWSCHEFTGLLPHDLQSFAFATTHPSKIYMEFFSKKGCHPGDWIGPYYHSVSNTSSDLSVKAVAVALAYRN
ncbi:hypothetical protein BJ138DRAFT_1159519 [Hygrophoropsis aurantiaca]|uniref:Uncharacterized protein n=1 Tax=Hygrophoropsis aurantiaca TaxID=72124 RepID=A0ACB8A310_9AGAM|nr:hypothetical protein BJ138DRAFT_1159519 [Hygrophoropsis aurantiaca]